MPNVIVLLVDRLDVALLVERLGPDRATAVGQDVEAQHVGRTLLRLGAQHLHDALDRLAGHALTGADEGDDLVEQALGDRDLGGLAGERDPVAADVDGRVEGALDQPEVLVARAQDRDHVDAVGDHDRVGRSSWGCRCGWLRVVSVMDARCRAAFRVGGRAPPCYRARGVRPT